MSISFVTPWAVACQTPLSLGFPRQEYWSRLPFPSPGDLPNPGIESESAALAGRFIVTEPSGNLMHTHTGTHAHTHTHTHTHTSTFPDTVLGLGVLWQTGQTDSLFSSCRRRRQMGRNTVGRDREVQILSGNMGRGSGSKFQLSSEILIQA